MSDPTQKLPEISPTPSEKSPGFFGRMFQKLDDAMKQKAEEKSKESRCCSEEDSKGGKCC